MSGFIKTALSKIGKTSITFRRTPLLLMSVMMICSLTAQAGGYTYELIDPFGDGEIQIFGLDQTGNVTGGVNPGDGNRVGFILDSASGELTLVPELTVLFDLNNSGAGAGDVGGLGDTSICAIRDKRGEVTTFNPPSVQAGILTDCDARGRNARGVVSGWEIGFDQNNDITGWVGFIHDPKKGTFEEFLPTAGNEHTIVGQINARGEVAGNVRYRSEDQIYPGSPPGRYGFRRNANGSFKFFTINGSLQTRARGISDSGLMTGFFLLGDVFRPYVAQVPKGTGFDDVTIPDDQILDLGSCVPPSGPPPYPPGPGEEWTLDNDAFAAAVSNDGTVVGSCDGYWVLRDFAGNLIDFEYLGSTGYIATPN